jgi:acyl carrier protein
MRAASHDPAVHAALAQAGATVDADLGRGQRLQEDLGIDSLSLLDVVESLQDRYGVLVPDEDIGRLVTVGDLFEVVTRLLSTHVDTAAGQGHSI